MRREGKEVQSFFFLVNEHISPSAGMGGGRHGGGGGGGGGGVGAFGGLQCEGMEDRQAYLTSLLATSP